MNPSNKHDTQISPALAWVFATACGLIVANLYYAQPLVGLIGPELGLRPDAITLVVTLTQIGYGIGLLALVPLGDLLENRRLVVILLAATSIGVAVTADSSSAIMFLSATLVTGICSAVAQILVPFAASLAPAESRGRVVGHVMSGLISGIVLARPLASIVADLLGWRAIYIFSAVTLATLTVALRFALPQRQPTARAHYGQLLASLWQLLRDTPLLRRRAAYHAAMFAAFSLYWTSIALELAAAPLHYTQRGIALFALAGAAGALAAPLAGRWADRGWTRPATGCALASAIVAFALAAIGDHLHSVTLLLCAALLLDFATSVNLVLGQRGIYQLGDDVRSRLNALYMALFFIGGGIGSALAGYAWVHGGWLRICEAGAGFALLALLYYGTEFLGTAHRAIRS